MLRASLLALVFFALPLHLAAQQPATPPQVSPEVQEWIMEMQQIQAQLAPVQQQALQDPELQAAQETLATNIRAAMIEADPTLENTFQRVEAIQAEAEAAQQAGDQERMMRIAAEAQQIQQQVAEAQSQALQQPEIAQQVETFQNRLQARMVEINPEAQGLLQRYQELEGRVLAAMPEQQRP